MIKLNDLRTELIEVPTDELRSVVGGLFGGTASFKFPPPITVEKSNPPTQLNTPSIVPTLPTPGSYTPDQFLQNVGISTSDGKGNIFEVGPGRASFESNGNGVGIQVSPSGVGAFLKGTW